jgi:hypothetical protein
MRRALALAALLIAATACGNDTEAPVTTTTGTTTDAGGLPDGSTILADGAAQLPDGNVVQQDGAPLDATPTGDSGAEAGEVAISDTSSPPADAQPGDTTTPPQDVAPPQDTVAPQPDAPPLSDTKTADGSTAKYTTCTGVMTCASLACAKPNKAGCDAVCIDAASQWAAALYLPYATCLGKAVPACQAGKCAQQPGQPAPPENCANDCANEECGFLVLACMNDGKTGNAPCSSLFPCQEACKKNEFQCTLDCYGAMSAQGQQQLQSFFSCAAKKAEDSNVDDPFAACPNELLQCLGDGKVGTGACSASFECFFECAQKGGESAIFGCLSECYPKATAAGQKRFANALGCLGKDGQSPPSKCGGIVPLIKCYSSGVAGTASCVALADCISGCNFGAPQGWSCAGKCWDGATAAAQSVFSDAATCGDDATPKCQAGVLTCANAQGSKTCLDVAGCVGQCKDNMGCVIGCVKQGSATEAKKAVDLLACSAQKGCGKVSGNESTDCLKAQCKGQFDACLAK